MGMDPAPDSLAVSAPALIGMLRTAEKATVHDPVDLAVVFDRCGAAFYRYFAVRTGGDVHLADDLMQQLWLHASRAATPTDSENELEHWLFAIARNLIRAQWRTVRRRPDHVPIADPRLATELAGRLTHEELPADLLERREVRDQLLLAITELPTREQALIISHYFDDRSHAELAAETGLTVRAIEGRLYRARRALQEKLEHLEP